MVSDSSKELVSIWLTDVWAAQLSDSPPAAGAPPAEAVSHSILVEAAQDYGEAAAEWVCRGATEKPPQPGCESPSWLEYADPGPCQGSH